MESHSNVLDLPLRLAESWMLQLSDTRIGFPRPALNVVIDSCQKICKIEIKRTLGMTFLDCLALMLHACHVIGELLPE